MDPDQRLNLIRSDTVFFLLQVLTQFFFNSDQDPDNLKLKLLCSHCWTFSLNRYPTEKVQHSYPDNIRVLFLLHVVIHNKPNLPILQDYKKSQFHNRMYETKYEFHLTYWFYRGKQFSFVSQMTGFNIMFYPFKNHSTVISR